MINTFLCDIYIIFQEKQVFGFKKSEIMNQIAVNRSHLCKINKEINARLHIVDEPLDAMNVIRKLSSNGHISDASLYICSISDIVKKHEIWNKNLPRCRPFYGKSPLNFSFTKHFLSQIPTSKEILQDKNLVNFEYYR